MNPIPIDRSIVHKYIQEQELPPLGKANIRQIKKLINCLEQETGQRFIRMEMGVPGLSTPSIAVEAEIDALRQGVSCKYPEIEGLPQLKHEISRFIRKFFNVTFLEGNCIPTVGSINGCYAAFMVAGRMEPGKDTILFIDPGFSAHKQLVKMIGLKQVSFDVYNYRGHKLRPILESFLKQGNIAAILYSNPNNPSWICFTEMELQIIGELANQYKAVVVEDLAYVAMDFRREYDAQDNTHFFPTVAKFADNVVALVSSSKAFSYAGQRIGMMAISEKLSHSKHPHLCQFFASPDFFQCLVYGVIYVTTAGVCHSTQYGLAAVLKAVNDGHYNFLADVREYANKAHIIKKIFLENNFHLVYDQDIDQPIGDGFFFTASYPNLCGEALTEELIYYGISVVPLSQTGSQCEGVRVCVSRVKRQDFSLLEERIKQFVKDHPVEQKQGI